MVLDADKYRVNVKPIKELTIDQTPEERIKFLSMLAVSTGVPIIIVACYVGELYGFSPELNAYIERLKNFYTIKEVLNVRNG